MKWLQWMRAGLVVSVLVAPFYWAYSYSGPYRWLAELSMRVFGSYYPKQTFLSVFVLTVSPSVLLLVRFDPMRGKPLAPDRARAVAAQTARMQRIRAGVILTGVGAVLFFFGGRDLLVARAGASLIRTSCASIEAGNVPSGTWLEIQGATLAGAAIVTHEGPVKDLYVPLVSDTWSKARPLPVVLRLDGDSRADLSALSFVGGVSPEDLPGMVRTAYEAEGVQAQDALVLDVGRVPRNSRTRGQLLAVGGLLVLLVGVFLIRRNWDERGPVRTR